MTSWRFLFFAAFLAGSVPTVRAAGADHVEILISVRDQKLCVTRDGRTVASFKISTSKFGLGDGFGSYRTPLGELTVSQKLGGGLQPGAVLKGGRPTGEVLSPNAKGRDPIVTRILRLRGLSDGTQNAEARRIYIHGTPEERTIGRKSSYGCIRMRSNDVIKLFENVPVGSRVVISDSPIREMSRAVGRRLETASRGTASRENS